jgi:NAD(P)-dependent dehydrogenase (short-subunit alcohol dehydrogenase family)
MGPGMSASVERTAIVTGGSAGIGAAICRGLLDAGYEVISLARRPASAGARLESICVDLADSVATQEAVQSLAKRRPVSTIVHNAGAVREKVLEETTHDDLSTLFNLHMACALTLVQANLAHMKAEHFGRVVLVSTRAILGLAKRTAYSATKAGMIGLSRTWALELAPVGITVNAVAPGPIEETAIFNDIIPTDSPKRPAIVQSIPVKRLGLPDDVARAVLFFTAPENSFVTGQTLFVCGGTSVGSITF